MIDNLHYVNWLIIGDNEYGYGVISCPQSVKNKFNIDLTGQILTVHCNVIFVPGMRLIPIQPL